MTAGKTLAKKLYNLQRMEYHSKGVFIWRRASPIGRASSLCRDPASQLNSLSKFVFVYERASPPWRDLAIDYRDLA